MDKRKRVALAAAVGVLIVVAAALAVLYLRDGDERTVEEKLLDSPISKVLPSDKTFADIAKRKYGDVRFWYVVAKANPAVSKLTPQASLRVPDRELAEAFLREVRQRRGGAMVKTEPSTAEGFPLSASEERWLADSVDALSPDKEFVLCDVRSHESPGRNWTVGLMQKSNGKVLGKWGMKAGDFEDVAIIWSKDSRRFIVRVRTGYDEVLGEGPGTKFGYVLGAVPESGGEAKAAIINSHKDLSRKAMLEVLELPVDGAKKRLRP